MSDRVALVIGGGSGIGRACALRLAKDHRVVVAGRTSSTLEETVAAIASAGREAALVVGDVTSTEDPGRIVRAASERGRIAIAINAFGTTSRSTNLDRLDAVTFDRIFDTNYRGAFLAMQAEARSMIITGGGAIVNVASVLGTIGWAGQSAYAASKHALIGLAQTMALELIGQGVRINTVCPGLVRSPMLERLAPKSLKVPPPDLTHAPDVDAVAEAIVHLASDAGRAIFGQAIEIGANVRRIT
jgi:NAD(P)-dependent dehydrogenase (short-subunit alcohol dehydrogenase family)